jgi:hypothetical protein
MTPTAPSSQRLFAFIGGASGPWIVDRVTNVAGESLPSASRVSVVPGPLAKLSATAAWTLRGITSNERYTVREEKSALVREEA